MSSIEAVPSPSFPSMVVERIHDTFHAISSVKCDLDQFAKVGRIVKNALTIANLQGIPIVGRISTVLGLIDAAQIASDVDYVNKREFTRDSAFNIVARVAATVVDAVTAYQWLQAAGIQLGKEVFNRIGNSRYFSFIAKIPLAGVLTAGSLAFFGFSAAESIRRLWVLNNSTQEELAPQRAKQTTKTWLDLAMNVTAIAAIVLEIVVPVATPVILGLAIISAGLGVSSFVYGVFNEEAKLPV